MLTEAYRACTADWQPHEDEVHLFLFSLNTDRSVVHRCCEVLSAEETRHLSLLEEPHLRDRFSVARGVTRELLGHCLGQPGADLRIATAAHGKPILIDHSEVQFNLSHSVDMALLGICRGQPVGVDLEALRAMPDVSDQAERRFAPGEQIELAAFPEDARPAAFLRGWTRKQSYVKALGIGTVGLESFRVSLDATARFRSNGSELGWQLMDVSPSSSFIAAACVPSTRVAWHRWRLTLRGDWLFPDRRGRR